jgi:predicted transcriptional regulator
MKYPKPINDMLLETRKRLVLQLHEEGYNGAHIGSIFGITKARINQIIKEKKGNKNA